MPSRKSYMVFKMLGRYVSLFITWTEESLFHLLPATPLSLTLVFSLALTRS